MDSNCELIQEIERDMREEKWERENGRELIKKIKKKFKFSFF